MNRITNAETLGLVSMVHQCRNQRRHSQADHGNDDVQHISGENVRNTEREAENNAQHTGPIISQLETSFGIRKCSV